MTSASRTTCNCLLALLVLSVAGEQCAGVENHTSLAGRWRFQLDRSDVGIEQRWFERTLPDRINLPGSLPAQGIGDPVTAETPWTGTIIDKSWFTNADCAPYRVPGNVKVPFWLQAETYYAGAAWFQRDVEIPKGWAGQRIVLSLERPHWETRVWVDGLVAGTNRSLSTPHEYELGTLTPGRHTLTLRVDNRMIVDVGENSHSVSDHTQGNWNGVVGRLELRSTPQVWIEDVQVYPRVGLRSAMVKVSIGSATGRTGAGKLDFRVSLKSENWKPAVVIGRTVAWNTDGAQCEAELPLGDDASLWDEFNPALYELIVTLGRADGESHSRRIQFGMREIATEGTQFVINGRKTILRGTLDCCIYPSTGHPPTHVEEWRRVLNVCRAHGLNLIRFHSWCPPEAAFVAADELGMYLQVECSSWANTSTTIGDGKPVDRWLYEEADRILKSYGNHPSFLLFLYGNEPAGDCHQEYLARWVAHYRDREPRRLISSSADYSQLPVNQFNVMGRPRIQHWGEGLNSRINARPPETATDYRELIQSYLVPVISHEIGQWCAYPNFEEIRKYTGHLKPRNLEIFRDRINANGMGRLAKQFLLASGRLQALCYKEEIESALRTPGMGGFQMLGLHDFPGQGTAPVGVLDPFWESKGYITAAEYRRFCNSTVPLARLEQRIFTTDEMLIAEVEVAHFGPAEIRGARGSGLVKTLWTLADADGKAHAAGEFLVDSIRIGNSNRIGRIHVPLVSLPAPSCFRLSVSVSGRMPAPNGSVPLRAENDWDIWVYPAASEPGPPDGVLVTARFDDKARRHLASGGKLLLTIPGTQVRNFDTRPVIMGFSSIFWNTAWTSRQPPTTLGILCDPKHPALASFPTEFHSDWQWWYLVHRAGALRLDLLPKDIEPIVRVIDDWATARPLGLVVEAKAGRGQVIICGFDLTQDACDPVSRQMRTSLLHHLRSKHFNPSMELTADQITSLIVERTDPPN